MTIRAKLTNKIHQTEDKIKETAAYIDRLSKEDWGRPYIKNERKKLDRYQNELSALVAEYEALPKLEEVPAIKSFLDAYGKKVLSWIEECHRLYPEKCKELDQREKQFLEEHPEYNIYGNLSYKGNEIFKSQNYILLDEIESLRLGNFLYKNREDYVERDKELKYIDLVESVKAICGKITDASFLRVGEKGELNGYIDGDSGRAKIQTFGAGGYNIQRYHFRTRVTDITPKEERR